MLSTNSSSILALISVKPTSNCLYDTYMPNHNVIMFLTPVIALHILDVTRKFKPKTSYGADGISTKLLKDQ
jgi:hypothetical protein